MRYFVLMSVVVAGGIVGWLAWRQSVAEPLKVSGFIEADEIRVGSRVGGRVARVAVQEGQEVAPDDPIFTIEPFDLQEQRKRAEAELALAEAQHAKLTAGFREEEIQQARARRDRAAATLEKLVAGPRPYEIEIAQAEVKAAEANLELAEFEFERLRKLREEAEAAKTEFDRAVRDLKASRAELVAAQQRLALLQEGTRREEIAEARATLAEASEALRLLEQGYRAEEIAESAARVAAAKASLAAIEDQIEELTVRSPCGCVVDAIDLQPGDLVASNAPAAALLDLSELWVRAYVPEAHLGHIRLDQRVAISVDSFPERRFGTHITFIAKEAEFTPRNVQTPEERSKQVFRIKVTIEEGLDVLRPGMAADVWLDEAAR